jgi:periplasmic protein TonB
MSSSTTYRVPQARGDLPLAVLVGAVSAFVIFVLMALAQMIGHVKPPANEIDETVMAFNPPETLQIEAPPPPPPEEKEPTPELEQAPPQLSLDQLDIALNPGTGGSLAGDFAMPTVDTSQQSLGSEDFVDFSELDQVPRPIGVVGFDFPRRLKEKPVSGTLVLMLKLDDKGEVLDAQLVSSDLPAFNDVVVSQIRRWRFTPPTKNGRPVHAQARLPIPINIH